MATKTEPSPADRPLVFVSYSHKDEIWKDRLRPHLGLLERGGRIVIWDDRQIGPTAMVAPYTVWYKSVRVYKTMRVSPAMAADVADRLWSMEDLAKLVGAAAPKPGRRRRYKKQMAAN
jgi:hypothetical protein